MEGMDVHIRRVDGAADPHFAAFAACYKADWADREPHDPVPSDAVVAVETFGIGPDKVRFALVALVDDEPAGYGMFTTKRVVEGSIRVADFDLYVLPTHRRTRVATALLADALPALEELGQESLITAVLVDVWQEEGAGFCGRLGMTPRMEERCSRLLVDAADDAAIGAWIAEGPGQAPGYRLVQWEGPCPDEWAEAWCAADGAIVDAPVDELDFQASSRDVDATRAADELDRANGLRLYRTLALGPGDEPAGATCIYVNVDYPTLGYQGNTAVRSAHRGKRLGRWLKAANYRATLAAEPQITVVETYNAESNPWMLDINVAMGFRPHHTYAAYQAPTADIAAALRGLTGPSATPQSVSGS